MDILSIDDLPIEKVHIPEWDTDVYVKALTAKQRDLFESSVFTDRGKDLTNIRAKLCALSIVDDSGKHLYSLKDAPALGEKNAKALDRIFAVAKRLSGIGRQEIESLKKNLRTTH